MRLGTDRLRHIVLLASALAFAVGIAGPVAAGHRHWTPFGMVHDHERRMIWYLGFHPEAPDHVFLSRSGQGEPGLYHSPDGGRTWEPWGADEAFVFDLVFVPGEPETLYAAAGDGVYRIEESGRRWIRLGIEVRPRDRGTFYALERVNRRTWIAGGFPGLFHSTDGGATWTQVMKPRQRRDPDDPVDNIERFIQGLDADPAEPATVYATAYEWISGQSFAGPVVYRSRDGGATWSKVLHGGRVALVPGRPGSLYGVKLDGAVLSSADAGATWQQAGRMKPLTVLDVLVDPVAPETLYVAARGRGVLRSPDGGVHWEAVSSGLDRWGQRWVLDLVAHPRDRHRFFAVTLFQGIFQALFPGPGRELE